MSETELPQGDEVTCTHVLDLFDQVDWPALVTKDVSTLFGISTDQARDMLRDLEEDGKVKSRKRSGILMWWKPDTDATDMQNLADDAGYNIDLTE
jgi:Mn-dependent DtxR family transcriptional regulator